MNEPCDFYTIKKFAEKLGVHENTVRRAIKKGRIGTFRLGEGKKARHRIPHTEIDRIMLFDLRLIIRQYMHEEETNGGPSSTEAT